MHNKIFSELAQSLKEAISKSFPESNMSQEEIYKQIGKPPNPKLGHFAFACFPLAKAFKSSPVQIAKKIEENLSAPNLLDSFGAQGPYLNVFIKSQFLGNEILTDIMEGSFFKKDLIENPPKTMIEFSQPNTHKELHVGHMRNLCLGNATALIHKYSGHETIPVTYPGDSGTHVAKCLWYLKNHNKDPLPEKNKGAWLGQLYTRATAKLEEELGTEKEAGNRTQLGEILQQLKKEEGEFHELWKKTREWSLDLMKEAYRWAGVEFERWFFESEEDHSSVELAKKLYDDKVLVESEGAIGIDLSEDKLGFCILIKSDGNGNYATKDISLAKKKFEEFQVEKSVYVVDDRQSYHFQQIFKTLDKMGFEQSKDCFHLKYNVVELPDGAMSSRKGNIVPLMDLLDSMEKTIKENYLNQYKGNWDQEEIDRTAAMVANGAIKYGMVRVDNNRKIVFDMKEWLKLDGETGPYLQYVYARIQSLIDKIGLPEEPQNFDWSILEKEQEKNLMIQLGLFNSTVEMACLQYKTSFLCSYLYELGKFYNSFYAECSVAKAENEELKIARLHLSSCVAKVMEKGLSLLGIPCPKRM
ncbi:MAG: arginine--tRNA ligase [Bdellovibrionota bacterium]|nr:arginine--tRNA ligase [Bdellovibrionota bacterium]